MQAMVVAVAVAVSVASVHRLSHQDIDPAMSCRIDVFWRWNDGDTAPISSSPRSADWISPRLPDCVALCAVTSDRTVLCQRNGEVVVIGCATERKWLGEGRGGFL